jgi:GMP synthase (glutamine-hydrolysing)
MSIEERFITNEEEAKKFIEEKVAEIKQTVGSDKTILALSGGVDSSALAVLGHRALGDNLKAFFVDHGLMREGEPEQVKNVFADLGITVEIVKADDLFFNNLAGKTHPNDKRVAIRDSFYKEVLPQAARDFEAKYLMQGTILTDIEATAQDSKAPQHNVLEQIGIDIELKLIESLKELRKPSVRQVAKALGLPESIWNRMPFLGPALSGRVVGEVTREKIALVKKATVIVEEELKDTGAFQYFVTMVHHEVPNNDRTKIGYALVVRCIDSQDAVTASPTKIDWEKMIAIRDRLYQEIPEVFRVCWDLSEKPPASVEWV